MLFLGQLHLTVVRRTKLLPRRDAPELIHGWNGKLSMSHEVPGRAVGGPGMYERRMGCGVRCVAWTLRTGLPRPERAQPRARSQKPQAGPFPHSYGPATRQPSSVRPQHPSRSLTRHITQLPTTGRTLAPCALRPAPNTTQPSATRAPPLHPSCPARRHSSPPGVPTLLPPLSHASGPPSVVLPRGPDYISPRCTTLDHRPCLLRLARPKIEG